MKHVKVPVDCLVTAGNPRTDRTEQDIASMVASIQEIGLEEPIKVEELPGDMFLVLSGGTRTAAVKRLGWKLVDVMIYDKVEYKDEQERVATQICRAIVPNVRRKAMDPVDEGREFNRLAQECGWGVERISRAVGEGVSYIQARLNVYRQPLARNALQTGKLKSVTDAEKLAGLIAHFQQEDVNDPILHEVGAILDYYEKHDCLNPRWLDDLVNHYKKSNVSRDPLKYEEWLSANPDYAAVYQDYCWGSLLSKTEKTTWSGKETPYTQVRNRLKYGESNTEAVKAKALASIPTIREERPRTRQDILLDCARLLIEQEELGPKQIVSELFGALAEADGRAA